MLGASLFAWALRTLGTNYSPCFDSYVPNAICRAGPYSKIRHPIYTANMLQILGVAIASGSLILFANVAVLAVLYFITANNEESVLLKALPEYSDYVQTSSMFLPSLQRQSQ